MFHYIHAMSILFRTHLFYSDNLGREKGAWGKKGWKSQTWIILQTNPLSFKASDCTGTDTESRNNPDKIFPQKKQATKPILTQENWP